MDEKPEKKENGTARAGSKAAAKMGAPSPRKAKKAVELTEEEIRAEKRRKLTLKVFRLVYEDHHKSR